MKPIELIEMALGDNKDKKTVFDAFAWSGSTLITSEKLWKKCYTIEYEPKYIQVILKRYYNYTDWKKEIKCLNRELDLSPILN